MGAADLLADLADAGLTIRVDAGKLLVKPASKLTDDLLGKLRAAKPELLRLLALPHEVDAPGPQPVDGLAEREAFEERAAIMEFDGGMTRTEAEAAARAAARGAGTHCAGAGRLGGLAQLNPLPPMGPPGRQRAIALDRIEVAAQGSIEHTHERWLLPARVHHALSVQGQLAQRLSIVGWVSTGDEHGYDDARPVHLDALAAARLRRIRSRM